MAQKNHQLIDLFKSWFPMFTVKGWWTKGKYAIRVRTVTFDEDLVFTWGDDGNWSLMTISAYDYILANRKA